MPNLGNLTKLHGTRKQISIYDTKKQMALERWLAKATTHFDTPTIRKQAIEKFNNEYPPFHDCPVEGSKLSRCPDCGWENTNIQK